METITKEIKEFDNDKSEKNSFLKIMLGLIFIVMFWALLDNKESKIKALEVEVRNVHYELYDYKKNVVLNNKALITKYILNKFESINEYRLISIANYEDYSTLTVIVNEPIKTTKNELGYKKDNFYLIDVKITPEKLELIELTKQIPLQANNQNKSIIEKTWYQELHDFFPNPLTDFILEFERFTKKVNIIVLESERSSIEKPIYLEKN